MAVGKYHYAHEDSECCHSFHRRRYGVIEHIINYKSCEREGKLKNSGHRSGYILKPSVIDTSCEQVGDKDEKEYIDRIDGDFLYYGSPLDHFVWKKDDNPSDQPCKKESKSESVEMRIMSHHYLAKCRWDATEYCS